VTNIAFTTLIILTLIVPGYVFWSVYNSGPFTRQVLPKNWTDDIARTFVWSLPFHLIGVTIVDHWVHAGLLKTDLNILLVFRLVSGNYETHFSEIVRKFYINIHQVILYHVSLLLAAWFLGYALRRVVWDRQLDLKYPALFGYRNQWMYTLTGRGLVPLNQPGEFVLPYLDALVEIGDKTRLYRGVFYDFSADQTGAPTAIFLIEARRGRFRKVEGQADEFYWQPIPGDFFVLKFSEIKNLNISYYVETPPSDQPSVQEFSLPEHQAGHFEESSPASPGASVS